MTMIIRFVPTTEINTGLAGKLRIIVHIVFILAIREFKGKNPEIGVTESTLPSNSRKCRKIGFDFPVVKGSFYNTNPVS